MARWPSGLRRQTKDQSVSTDASVGLHLTSGLSGRGFESHSRQIDFCGSFPRRKRVRDGRDVIFSTFEASLRQRKIGVSHGEVSSGDEVV